MKTPRLSATRSSLSTALARWRRALAERWRDSTARSRRSQREAAAGEQDGGEHKKAEEEAARLCQRTTRAPRSRWVNSACPERTVGDGVDALAKRTSKPTGPATAIVVGLKGVRIERTASAWHDSVRQRVPLKVALQAQLLSKGGNFAPNGTWKAHALAVVGFKFSASHRCDSGCPSRGSRAPHPPRGSAAGNKLAVRRVVKVARGGACSRERHGGGRAQNAVGQLAAVACAHCGARGCCRAPRMPCSATVEMESARVTPELRGAVCAFLAATASCLLCVSQLCQSGLHCPPPTGAR